MAATLSKTLFAKDTQRADVIITGARVLDPVAGVDAVLDVRVDDGIVAALGEDLARNGHRVVEAAGRTLAPAFVDPHVHLRTPGREDEETIASGTAAAAAGGYCAILAMPNTDPVVDSAAVLGSLVDDARAHAAVPVGFLAAITRGQDGAELTDMAELADRGAAGFSDDGRPVASAGLMRRALQYVAVAGRPLALHCEEPTLSRGGQMHEGAVSAELGFAGYPSVAESLMVERDLALADFERPPAAPAPPVRPRVRRGAPRGPRGRHRRDGRGHAAPPLPHRRGRADARPQPEDEPAAPRGRGPRRARRRPAGGHDHLHRHRPRAARAPREGGAVRGRPLRRHRASRPRSRRSTRTSSSRG